VHVSRRGGLGGLQANAHHDRTLACQSQGASHLISTKSHLSPLAMLFVPLVSLRSVPAPAYISATVTYSERLTASADTLLVT